ncbi:MAG: tyrosine-protein phosphatase [Sandaracinaceae bacterium]|nr:tyrosine-protein phosphatase [Sandaracinaceae bacterium]
MKRWRGIALAAAASVGLTLFLTVYAGRPELAPVGLEASRLTDRWVDVTRRRARAGYWIVVRGTHFGDQVVAAGSAADLTHAAVYDAATNEVIEAHGSGVEATPLRELLAQARRFLIVRPRDWTAREGASAVERARSHIGSSYDWLGTIGMPSDRRYYCTELCVDAYRARQRGWMPAGVIHPTHMSRYGEVVFDSGPRPEESVAEISDALRARFARRIEGARGVAYAAEVAPGVLRGGTPDEDGVAWLRERGVRTVINLRHFHGHEEGERVREAGMRYEWIPLASTDAPEPSQVERFLSIVEDPASHPVYVHCLHGVDRTGAMIAIYRIRDQGWTSSDALAEMETMGAHGILHDLRRFVGAYTPP